MLLQREEQKHIARKICIPGMARNNYRVGPGGRELIVTIKSYVSAVLLLLCSISFLHPRSQINTAGRTRIINLVEPRILITPVRHDTLLCLNHFWRQTLSTCCAQHSTAQHYRSRKSPLDHQGSLFWRLLQ